MRQPGQGSNYQFDNTTRKKKKAKKVDIKSQVGATDPKTLKTNKPTKQTYKQIYDSLVYTNPTGLGEVPI